MKLQEQAPDPEKFINFGVAAERKVEPLKFGPLRTKIPLLHVVVVSIRPVKLTDQEYQMINNAAKGVYFGLN